MAGPKPTCGLQAPPIDSTFDSIVAVLLFLFGVPGIVIGVVKFFGLEGALTILGASGATTIWIAGAAGAVAVVAIIGVFWWKRCRPIEGRRDCAAGVTNEIEEAFNSGWDPLFPFAAQHDRVDVVVKCNYWPLVETGAAFVKCTGHPDPVDQSPILQTFFENDEVCAAALGALIGAAIGAAAGIWAGVAVAALMVALCAGPWIILCLLVALIIAAAVTLAAAAAGGAIGRWIADDGGPPTADGETIGVGDYITVPGNYVAHGDFRGAIVAWFVDGPTWHGPSNEPGPEFVHTDPDENLDPDACPLKVR